MVTNGSRISKNGSRRTKNCVLDEGNTCFFCQKKSFVSEIGLGACEIAWCLPAMLACYHGLCNWASTVVSSRAPKTAQIELDC